MLFSVLKFIPGGDHIRANRRKPYQARARIELARAQGLQPDSNAVDVLRKMGDIEYLESHDLGA
jgi:hypothetical protein